MSKLNNEEVLVITNKLVSDFSDLLNSYLIHMGINMVTKVTLKPINTTWTKALTLKELVEIADMEIGKTKSFPKGIKTKSRVHYIVIRRQVIGFLATELRVTYTEIGKVLNITRTTVLHGNKMIENAIETKDEKIMTVFSKLTKLANEYYNKQHGEDL